MFCPNCGYKLKADSKFCPECGNEIRPVDSKQEITIQDLVEKAKSGDESSFQKLYELTSSRNYYIALRMVKSDSDAQDVMQDAYIRIYQHLGQYTYTGESSFASWTSKIVSNTALNNLRKRQDVLFSDIEGGGEGEFSFDIEDEDTSRQPELAYDKKETAHIVSELLDELSDEQRICTMMFYYQEQSVKDIASEIGCSENTVKSRLHQGRKKMMSKAEELKKKGMLTGILSLAGLVAILRSNEAYAMEGVTSDILEKILNQVTPKALENVTTIANQASSGSSQEMISGVGSKAAGSAVKTGIALKLTAAILGVVALVTVGTVASILVMRSMGNDKYSLSSDVASSSAVGEDLESDNTEGGIIQKDPFQEFITTHEFLFDSEEEYEVTAAIGKNEFTGQTNQITYPMDIAIPNDIKNNLLAYDIDDYDLDNEDELLVLGLNWVDYSADEYSPYKLPYSVAKLKLEIYESNDGKLVKTSEYADFGDVDLTAAVERWYGSFKCYTFEYDGKLIIACEEEGSDYHARFSDGWENWFFAALTYENDKIEPLKESFVDIDFSGGDESFNCNGKDYLSLWESPDYTIQELKSVGIDYKFGDYFDYTSDTETEGKMPSDTIDGYKTILYSKNDTSSLSYDPTENETAAGKQVIGIITFQGGETQKADSEIEIAYKDFFDNREGEVSVKGFSQLEFEFGKISEISFDLKEFDDYKIIDIDSDGTPEMFMRCQHEGKSTVESYSNTLIFEYSKGKIVPVFGVCGSQWDNVYSTKDHRLCF